jgi:hypothetical protein
MVAVKPKFAWALLEMALRVDFGAPSTAHAASFQNLEI